ncbi:type II secretion system minor pseudopilin GspK [Legionella jordanis]|uniref:Type II secretion system protein K n=1 Tax=Legionella jordanis TaxID=456 RepID=A0A0W0V8B3_9GAMM|nr:type II secretion system minor pseudopilin GspK [Legionella jordanis]KTD16109.1 type II secretory pathway protein [Legionella jordanis]RMX04660.1 general secretion pathway protein GspK [Legionella jordanis]RMX18370.1 general secretion pathway protein GspK [Legionella jordanis]VEH12431.1 general secretion pathway protein K [Legionella jordanis]HAT8713942.1 general secretion pathway protein GspK [Legionella jordanis]
MLNNSSWQKGSALISALFIMTLVAIAATAMTTRLQVDIYRTRLSILSDKLYLASQAVPFWAMNELTEGRNKFLVADKFGKVLDFPPQLKSIYPEVMLKGSLFDLQSRFNLNNLADKRYQLAFLKLLNSIPTTMNPSDKQALVLAIRHWISPYQPGRGSDEFVSYYLQQKPAYYPSQQLFQHISELRLIRGVDAKLFMSLSNYLTALPEITPININTAPPQILATLGAGLNDTQVKEILTARGTEGIKKLEEISPLLEKLNIRREHISIESQYFLCITEVSHPDLNLTAYTLLKRTKDKKGRVSVTIIAESLNSL